VTTGLDFPFESKDDNMDIDSPDGAGNVYSFN
jgi:hypothetical protein